MPFLIPSPAGRSVRRAPRTVFALLAAVIALLAASVPARAADDASDIVIDVADAATGAPITLARVLVQGEVGLVGYTDADGHARFESIATGSYRAMVIKRGFVVARSSTFDVTANRTATVRVRLQRTSWLRRIGSVSVSSSPARASREVGQDDALRFLDGSLRGALGDLPGVTSAGDGLQIDGNDASQTGTSIDGVPVAGAGGSLAARGINADLFGGASVSSGASRGALGGDVGFRTLQPTRFAQQQATLQYGSDNSSSALGVARGSIRNLGYVVEHAVRGQTSPLTGLNFTDATSLTYRHDGDRLVSGDLAKLRWAPSIAQTLTVTRMSTSTHDNLACAQLIARFPCGYGPGAADTSNGRLLTLSENATIGATTLMLGAFANGSRDRSNEAQRMLAGAAAPQRSELRANARGFNVGVQLPAGDRHDVSLSAQSYGLAFDGTTTTTLGTSALGQRTSFHGWSVVDRYHPTQRLTLTGRAGVNGGNGSNAFASGLDARWQPNRGTAYAVAGSFGDAGAGVAITGTAFPDPQSLTFDCANGLAYGSVPSVNAPRQRSSALRASAERSGSRGRLALTAWTARLEGAPVLTAQDASALGVPPSYLGTVAAFASSQFVCGSHAIGALAFTSFQPANQLSRGATLAGTLEIGKALIAGFASVQSRFVTDGTPATAPLSPVGMQAPGTPLHRAGLVATAKIGKSVDAVANLSYTAANNPNRLPAYTVLNAGLAAPLREGSIAVVGTNLGNAHAAAFASSADTFALLRSGAAPLALAATPLAARAVTLTYTVRTGRLGAAGSGAASADASAPEEEDRSDNVRVRTNPLHEGEHPNALQIDSDNDLCTPTAAKLAQPVMDAMGRIAASAERAKSNGHYPAALRDGTTVVSGVTLTYTPYDGGTRFVVAAASNTQGDTALINCAHLGVVQPGDRENFHVYLPEKQTGFFVAYSPAVGMYFAPPAQAERGAAIVRLPIDPEPPAPPTDPFALRAAPACSAGSKPVADAIVAAVRAARAAQHAGAPIPSAEVAQIVARGSAAASWLEIMPADAGAQVAMATCVHVAAVPSAHLHSAGIADARSRGIGFSDRFGFYLIMRPPQ